MQSHVAVSLPPFVQPRTKSARSASVKASSDLNRVAPATSATATSTMQPTIRALTPLPLPRGTYAGGDGHACGDCAADAGGPSGGGPSGGAPASGGSADISGAAAAPQAWGRASGTPG